MHLLVLPVPSSLPLFLSLFSTLESLFSSDNTARILTRRSGFRQQEQSVFYLPILIADSGQPVLSSTGTLTIQVCSCDDDGHVLSCSPEAYMLPVSLSRGALIAILACIFVLLGEQVAPFSSVGSCKYLLSYHSNTGAQNRFSMPRLLKRCQSKAGKE